MVRHAATTVPAYQQAFAQTGLRPADIRSLADFAQLPITTKADVQRQPLAYVSDAVPRRQLLKRTTSGSTGTPLTVHNTPLTVLAERAIMYRGWRWAGFESGDRIVTCVGELSKISEPGIAPVDRYRNTLDISPHHLDVPGCQAYIKKIGAFDPHYIRTYPSVLRILGKILQRNPTKLPSLKGLWTQSEVLYPSERQYLESVWGARAFDYYGMQEKCVAMSECSYGTMHIHSDFGLVEFAPAAKEPYQRIIATGFYNPAMPLLRYDTGDLAITRDDPCPCGRALPAVRSIVGRQEDFLFTTTGRHVIEIDAAIGVSKNIRACQIVQEAIGDVRLHVVPAPGFDDHEETMLKQRLREQFDDETVFTIVRCDELKRTATGKLRFIICKVSTEWER